ncbi:MAG: fimbrial chaperone protein [Gammaproteobacteria bacterium]|jgi:P pilus assembly chaperone PapD
MKIVVNIIAVGILLSFFTSAQANLLVTPKRIVFDERERTQQVVLINASNQRRSYRLEWVEQKQIDGGAYRLLKEEDAQGRKKASDIMRFSPRQVRLGPGERQVVKILARRKANMEPGEYRSHLLFSALPLETEASNDMVDGMSMKLNVLVSYSIPVMLNVNYKSPQIFVSDVQVNEQPEKDNKFADVIVTLNKTGNYSTYGKVKAYFKADNQDSFKEVGLLNGVSIFAEANVYIANLTWSDAPEARRGELKIRYEGDAEFSGTTFTEEVLSINL